jgi:hypothetical protein
VLIAVATALSWATPAAAQRRTPVPDKGMAAIGGIDSSDNKFGGDVGAGIEYFLTRRDTLLGEVTFHAIPGTVTSYRSAYEAGYWTLCGGYKRYFGK